MRTNFVLGGMTSVLLIAMRVLDLSILSTAVRQSHPRFKETAC
jgi:hypothetical protein